jgi:hypothetical protein
MKLADFRVLTFDCYGTLIDWESGIHSALQPLLRKAGLTLPRDAVLEAFARHEYAQEAETPGMIYSGLLATVHRRLAKEWQGNAKEKDHRLWPVPQGRHFPIWRMRCLSQAALQAGHSFQRRSRELKASNTRLGVVFDAIYTAAGHRLMPPSLRYMLDHLARFGTPRTTSAHPQSFSTTMRRRQFGPPAPDRPPPRAERLGATMRRRTRALRFRHQHGRDGGRAGGIARSDELTACG